MSLDLPVFDLKHLRRGYYYFVAFNVLITLTSILFTALSSDLSSQKLLDRINTWLLLLILLFASFIYSYRSRKELKGILETNDYDHQFSKYENYFKKRLVWSGFSQLVSGAFFAMTEKNLFFYILIIQLILSLFIFPGKKLISRELKNNDIVYT